MTDALARAYLEIAPALGPFSPTVDPGPAPLPGELLTSPTWLADRIRDTGVRWSHPGDRVNGTLWWYSASSTLVAAPLTMLLVAGAAPDPRPDRLTICLRENGYLAAARSDRLCSSREEFVAALHRALGAVIAPLAAASGASTRALWAIATDSVANRALDAGRRLDCEDEAVALARAVTRPPLLPARFTDVTAPSGSRRFVHRSSCCLIYQATDGPRCASCPRRTPADRRAELEKRI